MMKWLYIMNMNSNFIKLIEVYIRIWTHTASYSEPEALLGVKNRRQIWKMSEGSYCIILFFESKFGPTF